MEDVWRANEKTMTYGRLSPQAKALFECNAIILAMCCLLLLNYL
ncbi:hypothetical protein [Thermosinus carboxydivorans]|nr:hypothetical protein [Thermosinus carboxydivorans]